MSGGDDSPECHRRQACRAPRCSRGLVRVSLANGHRGDLGVDAHPRSHVGREIVHEPGSGERGRQCDPFVEPVSARKPLVETEADPERHVAYLCPYRTQGLDDEAHPVLGGGGAIRVLTPVEEWREEGAKEAVVPHFELDALEPGFDGVGRSLPVRVLRLPNLRQRHCLRDLSHNRTRDCGGRPERRHRIRTGRLDPMVGELGKDPRAMRGDRMNRVAPGQHRLTVTCVHALTVAAGSMDDLTLGHDQADAAARPLLVVVPVSR